MKISTTFLALIICTGFYGNHCFTQDSLELHWSQSMENLSQATIFGPYIDLDHNGNVNLCGRTFIDNGINLAIRFVQYDSLGIYQWHYDYDTDWLTEYPRGMINDQEGNLYAILCQTSGYFSAWNIVKINALGGYVWDHQHPGSEYAQLRQMAIDLDDNIYVLSEEQNANTGFGQLLLSKFSPDGELLWQSIFEDGETSFFFARHGAVLGETYQALVFGAKNRLLRFHLSTGEIIDNFIIEEPIGFDKVAFNEAGQVLTASSPSKFEVRMFSNTGDSLWTFRGDPTLANPPAGVYARMESIFLDDLGNSYLVGTYTVEESTGLQLKAVTAKLNNDGSLDWLDAQGDSLSIPYGTNVLYDQGRVFVAGALGSTAEDNSYLEDRYLKVYTMDGQLLDEYIYDGNGNNYEIAQAMVVQGNQVYVTGAGNESYSVDIPVLLTQRYDLVPIINATQEVYPHLPDLDILPNPFTEQLVVRDPQGLVHHYRLTNSQGQLMQTGTLAREGLISVPSSLAPGIYWLELQNQEGQILQVESVVKQ